MTNPSLAKSGFTSGPWRMTISDYYDPENPDWNIQPPHEEACVAAVVNNCRPYDEVLANARLVTAAPELYEALKQARGLLDELTHPNTSNVSISSQIYFTRCVEAEAKARAAIAKAVQS